MALLYPCFRGGSIVRVFRRNWSYVVLCLFILLVMLGIRYKGFFYTRIHPTFMQFEGYRITQNLENYKHLNAGDFNIRYTEAEEPAAMAIKDISAQYGEAVLAFFRHQREHPVEVVIFPHESSLKGSLRIPQEQSAMGAYAGGIINLLSPNQFDGLNQDRDMLVNVFVHELAHLVVDDFAKGNYPLWFTEGVALYLEYDVLGYEWGKELIGDHGFTVEDLTHRFLALDEYRAYRASFQVVKGLIDEHGKEQLIQLLGALGDGVAFEQGLKEAYGMAYAELVRYWKEDE